MNGGTVSMCVEKTTSGGLPSTVARTLNLSCATGILCVVYPMLNRTSYSSAPTAASLPEMDSVAMRLRVRATGSMSALQDKWLNQISPRRHGEKQISIHRKGRKVTL